MIATGENDLLFSSEDGNMWVSHRMWSLSGGGVGWDDNLLDVYGMPAA